MEGGTAYPCGGPRRWMEMQRVVSFVFLFCLLPYGEGLVTDNLYRTPCLSSMLLVRSALDISIPFGSCVQLWTYPSLLHHFLLQPRVGIMVQMCRQERQVRRLVAPQESKAKGFKSIAIMIYRHLRKQCSET